MKQLKPFLPSAIAVMAASLVSLVLVADTYEINGFVRHPDGQGFNLWSCIRLDDAWSYIAED